MANDRLIFLGAVSVYGISLIYSVLLYRREFRRDDWINYGLIAVAFALHTMAMVLRGFSLQRCPITNLYEATIFVMWAITASYLVMGLWARIRFVGAFASPMIFCTGVFALMPSLDAPGTHQELSGAWESLHATMILLSYGAFGLAFVAALMFLMQEHNLKRNKSTAFFSMMPSIRRLEKVIERFLLVGFLLLTLGLSMGFKGLRESTGQVLTADPKVLWSILVWAAYGGMLAMRWKFALRGKRFALMAFSGFVFILFTFWGSNLLSGIHNPQ